MSEEKIRQLENRVHLAGKLAELGKVNEGVSNGVPYISFNGKIQFGETPVETANFRTFVKSKKVDGTDSKNYAKVKEWVANAVPMTVDPSNPTMVDMIGSLTDNPYISADGKLVEATQFSMQLFGDFKEYAAEIDLEGFIAHIADEMKDDEPTGRQIIRLVSRDIFSNILDIKQIIVPKEWVEPLEDNGYENGVTTTLYVNIIPHVSTAPAKGRGGIGVQRVQSRSYNEWVFVGAGDIIDSDSDKALSPALIKNALKVRAAMLEEKKKEGYVGSKGTTTTSTPASRNGIGSKSATKTVIDEDDFPF